MRLGYQFSNIYGSVYTNGNVIFTNDGDYLLSPVGNRLRVFNLRNDSSYTMPFEVDNNIAAMALSNDQRLLWIVDETGVGYLINYPKRIIIFKFNFKAKVSQICFSPDSKFFAVAKGKVVELWYTPKINPEEYEASITEYRPFILAKEYRSHAESVSSISWSPDSKFFLTGGKDAAVYIQSAYEIENYVPTAIRFHRVECVAAQFIDMNHIIVADQTGNVYVWKRGIFRGELFYECDEEFDLTTYNNVFEYAAQPMDKGIGTTFGSGPWAFHLFSSHNHYHITTNRNVKCTKAVYCHNRKAFCAAFNNGVFCIENCIDGQLSAAQTLTLNNEAIATCCVNPVYDWVAFGTPTRAQLAVYEWTSETFIVVQQGHVGTPETVKYSPNGNFAATASNDGKIKVWDTASGLCVSTFNQHVAPVTDLAFIQSESVISASLDGTVRAFDLKRFQNFRTMKPEANSVQFQSVTCDTAGEIVYAGTSDTFEIYAFSLRTGKELDVFAGHTGPVNFISFSPTEPVLYTASWDGTVRTWELYASGGPSCDTIDLGSPVSAMTISHDGKTLVVATSDSRLHWIDAESGEILIQLDIDRDITGGRRDSDTKTAQKSHYGKCFNSLAISPDGSVLLAGGDSNTICFYSMENRTLVANMKITRNRAVDGVLETINYSRVLESGLRADEIKISLDDFIDENILLSQESKSLPGAENAVDRNTKLEARCASVCFSPTTESFMLATSVGVLEFSKNTQAYFDPISFESSIVPELVDEKLEKGEFTKALCVALRLDDDALIEKVILNTPLVQVPFVCKDLTPEVYGQRFLKYLATMYSNTVHFYVCTSWAKNYLLTHPHQLKDPKFKRAIREIKKLADERTSVTKKQLSLVTGAMAFLKVMNTFKTKEELEAEDEAANNSESEEESEEEL